MLNAKHCAKLKKLGMYPVLLEKMMLLIATRTSIKTTTQHVISLLVLLSLRQLPLHLVTNVTLEMHLLTERIPSHHFTRHQRMVQLFKLLMLVN